MQAKWSLQSARADYSEVGLYLALACFLWLLSFLLARVGVSGARRWNDFSRAQCLATPILLGGYLVIGLVLPLIPAILVLGIASVPLAVDIENWHMFGQAAF